MPRPHRVSISVTIPHPQSPFKTELSIFRATMSSIQLLVPDLHRIALLALILQEANEGCSNKTEDHDVACMLLLAPLLHSLRFWTWRINMQLTEDEGGQSTS
jgi:hypothetical protein